MYSEMKGCLRVFRVNYKGVGKRERERETDRV